MKLGIKQMLFSWRRVTRKELNEEVEDDMRRYRASGRKTARKEAVASTVGVFTKRVFYREEEIEKIYCRKNTVCQGKSKRQVTRT